MMAVTIERNKKQLQILTEDIQKASVETELLRKKLLASHNWNAFDATLSATLLKDKSTELRDMIQRKLALEEQISPSRSYTTRVVDEIYISEKPVSPNKPLIIGLAVLMGLLGALVFAFVHNAITKKAL
jgi:LPS O-antigen subunit length determinant protein (WzzB/FepE family)